MPPQRIVSMLASATEMLYGLGLGERVVAVSHECDWPRAALTKPRVTTSHVVSTASSQAIDDQVRELFQSGQALYGIDVPALIALQPDLIVTQAQCDVCAVAYEDVLRTVQSEPALRATQVVALNPQHFADVLSDIRRVSVACGCVDEGERYVARLSERIEAVRRVTASMNATERPRVACIEWIEPLMIAANWMPDLIDWAGGVQTLTRGGEHSGYTPWDNLIAFDPEKIVIMPCGFDLPRTWHEAECLRAKPHWQQITAVRQGEVYAVDGNAYFNRSGPRLVDSLEILARLLHPRRFGLRGDESGEAEIWSRWSA